MKVLQSINGGNELKRRIAVCRKRVRRARATQKVLTPETQCGASSARPQAVDTSEALEGEAHAIEKGVEVADTIRGAADNERTIF